MNAATEDFDLTIIGAGFSGRMLLAQLAAQGARQLRVALSDPTLDSGLGRAWTDPSALLSVNVAAANLSAWPDRPDDFVEWWGQACRTAASELRQSFATRARYADYLRSTVRQALARGAMSAHESVAEVVDVQPQAAGFLVRHADGSQLRTRCLVLATGNPPPPALRGLDPGDARLCDPLQPDALQQVHPSARLLLLGSGLTAIDTLQQLFQRRHRGPISMLSRHGLLPAAHADSPVVRKSWQLEELGDTASSALRAVRLALAATAREGGDWRAVIDGLRPHSAALWRRWSQIERRRFLRHLRPIWDVHRHRAAGDVLHQVLDGMAEHPVHRLCGQLSHVSTSERGLQVHWLPRGASDSLSLDCDVVLNARAGGALDNPLLQTLEARGQIRADPLRLGLEVDASGRAAPGVYAIGPLNRARDWESTAIPELRLQAARLATHLIEELLS